MTDSNDVERRAAEQRQAFLDRHGYPAVAIPDIWIGQMVWMNVHGSGGRDDQLGSVKASGMLEAIRDDGFILSVEDRVVFIPREAVLQMEVYDPNRSP